MHNIDYTFGKRSESLNLPIFQNYFNCLSLKESPKKTSIFDFESENIFIELKTRRCLSSTYKDTMIGMNKIEFAEKNSDKDFYFCFQFLDGLFYWKFNVEEKEKLRFGKGGRWDRGKNEIKDYCYIPVHLLNNITI